MSINQVFQINVLPVDLLYQMFNYLDSNEKVSLAETCKSLFNKVSDFYNKNNLINETKYCFLSPRTKHFLFSPVFMEYFSPFNKLVSKLPCLLSSKGVNFRSRDGELKNASIRFNRDASEFFFICYSKDEYQITFIEPTKWLSLNAIFLNENYIDIYSYTVDPYNETLNAQGSISKKYQWSIQPFVKYYEELVSTEPIYLQSPIMDHRIVARISRKEESPLHHSLQSLVSKYDAENQKLDQKFGRGH